MGNKNLINKRENGVFYTPSILAEYLAKPFIKGQEKLTIFDPSYGDGALLLAAETVSKQKSPRIKTDLFGCDICPVNGLLKHLPEANLVKEDFFDYNNELKFDLILTNPPYIRHQNQNRLLIEKYKSQYGDLNILSNTSDLWAYFLIKSISHLKIGGSIGAILPWAFLQANYAQNLREWLLEKFENIRFLALRNEYFEFAQERVILLWMENYGKPCSKIEYSQAHEVKENLVYKRLSKDDWKNSKVLFSSKNKLKKLLSNLKSELGFSTFENYADAKIGVVTGANDFFIKTYQEAVNLGFDENQLQPIITSVKELPGFMVNGVTNLKRLICIKKEEEIFFNDYLKIGENQNLHLRAHSKQRNPWYAVKQGVIPDGFFTYRVSEIPYLIINELKVQCTNSIHRIYFKNLSEIQQKWLQLSILSIYSQLSLEAESKTYGRGILKIEPGSLKKTLVIIKNDECINDIYPIIQNLLKMGNKPAAMNQATMFLNEYLNISEELINIANSIWNNIHR